MLLWSLCFLYMCERVFNLCWLYRKWACQLILSTSWHVCSKTSRSVKIWTQNSKNSIATTMKALQVCTSSLSFDIIIHWKKETALTLTLDSCFYDLINDSVQVNRLSLTGMICLKHFSITVILLHQKLALKNYLLKNCFATVFFTVVSDSINHSRCVFAYLCAGVFVLLALM